MALETLAARRGRDLAADGVEVLAMGGATNIGRHLEELGPHGHDVRVAGLCDERETGYFVRGLDRAGLGPVNGLADLSARGFFVCVADLEDELIRALGAERVEQLIQAEGELASLHTLQRQPAQRGRGGEAHLRRFMGSQSGRKARYARVLVEALDLAEVPDPLDDLLAQL